MINLKEFTT